MKQAPERICHVLITEKDNATYNRLVAILLEHDHEPTFSLLDADDILKQIITERDSLRAVVVELEAKLKEAEKNSG